MDTLVESQEKDTTPSLSLKFHGRILDHLGIQMYQSPVAAIAEIISNSWDADSENVEVTLPEGLDENSHIVIKDDGIGMTLEECQNRYLNVGYNKRGKTPDKKSELKSRDLLGRKGIGKFAGFGISKKMIIDTISIKNGERTKFEMDLGVLKGDEEAYSAEEIRNIKVIEYQGPDNDRKEQHGTTIELKTLSIKRRIGASAFASSMSRRFLLHRRVDNFAVSINGINLDANSGVSEKIAYSFPKDYRENEKYSGLEVIDDWGIENLDDLNKIKWQIVFYENTIKEDGLKGAAVFSHGKLAQSPFAFNLTGGVRGQAGMEYMSGRVEADYLDELNEDIIATDRQSLDWKNDHAFALEEWGQKKLKELLGIRNNRQVEGKTAALEAKVSPLKDRLKDYPPGERRNITGALKNLAQIEEMSVESFVKMGDSILTAWERGRIGNLIDSLSQSDDVNRAQLMELFTETTILTSLQIGEVVLANIKAIQGLEIIVARQDRENSIRDYIAKYPWLISPEWETYRKEISVKNLIEKAAENAKMHEDTEHGAKRVDLVLSSGNTLLVLEFMVPGKKLDFDHLSRFQYYLANIRTQLLPETGGRFNNAIGYLVADRPAEDPGLISIIQTMYVNQMYALTWSELLSRAKIQHKDYLEALQERAPEEARLQRLTASIESSSNDDDQTGVIVDPAILS